MSRRVLCVALLALALAGSAQAAETYGEGVTLTETTPIARILADPEAYVGKKVRIEGKVTDVCPMAGCWMEIAAPEGGQLRIRVEDGVIVFPKTAPGKQASAEGVLERIPMDKEAYTRWMAHLAHEQGKDFDESTVTGEGPFHVLELRGLGARIE